MIKVIHTNSAFSLLDYGCGYGALLNYIVPLYPEFYYTGFDISEDMLTNARKQNNHNNVKWQNHLNTEIFDYCIASGIFNVKLEQQESVWIKYVIETLQELNAKSSYGFSFNMLTTYSDKSHKKDYLHYADPCFYFDYCKRNFSKNVALLHDYGLYEFSNSR